MSVERLAPRARKSLADRLGPCSLLVSIVSLGAALQVNYGQYHPLALVLLTASLFACVIKTLAGSPDHGRHARATDGRERGQTVRIQSAGSVDLSLCAPAGRLVLWAASAAVLIQFATLLATSPAATLVVRSNRELLPFRAGIALAACVTLWALHGRRFTRLAIVAIPVIHLSLGLWLLHSVPQPAVDVCVFQRDACRALLHGANPYAITFPNLYLDPARVYGVGLVSHGRVQFGFPYPPLSLLLVIPGHLVGDFRYAHLVATTLAGLLMMAARPSRLAIAAGALFLFTPRGFFVLEAGWTEPLLVLLLAATVFAAIRGWRGLPIMFGLLIASKQYLILAAPLGFLLIPPSRRWAWMTVGLTAVAVTIPLALWNLPAFTHSAVTLQFHQPLRMDSLSFVPWSIIRYGLHLPTWFPWVAAGLAIAFTWLRIPRTHVGFACACALVFLIFFASNKQAFCNYYHFVIGALCCALAAEPLGAVGAPVARGRERIPSDRSGFLDKIHYNGDGVWRTPVPGCTVRRF